MFVYVVLLCFVAVYGVVRGDLKKIIIFYFFVSAFLSIFLDVLGGNVLLVFLVFYVVVCCVV